MTHAEMIAGLFHATYETLAPDHGCKTREAGAVDWADVPAGNKALMIATVQHLINMGTIVAGPVVAGSKARAVITLDASRSPGIAR